MHGELKLKFMGFDPGTEIKNLAHMVAEEIYLSSPSDSVLEFALKCGKGLVEGSCRIASQAGIFVARSASDNPVRAIQKIEREIKRQLDNWKQQRFIADGSAYSSDRSA